MRQSIWLCLFACVVACSVADPGGATDEASSSAEVTPGDATPLESALPTVGPDEDPEAVAAVIAASGACAQATSCNGYGSCNGWSPATTCGPRFCLGSLCGKPCFDDPDCVQRVALGQYSQDYRVCFNSAGASCTEWSVTGPTMVGCAFTCP